MMGKAMLGEIRSPTQPIFKALENPAKSWRDNPGEILKEILDTHRKGKDMGTHGRDILEEKS